MVSVAHVVERSTQTRGEDKEKKKKKKEMQSLVNK